MALQSNIMHVRSDHYELTQHGTEFFPLASYESCLQKTPQGFFDIHWHTELEFCFPLHASVIEVQVENARYILRPGDGLFINRNRLHSVHTVGKYDGTYVSTLFSPKMISLFHGSKVESECVYPLVQSEACACLFLSGEDVAQGEIVRHMRAVHELHSSKKPEALLFLCAELMTAWGKILRMIPRNQIFFSNPADEHRVRLMINHIITHFQENIPLQSIADAAGINRNECCRLFKRVTGESPIKYLIKYRINASIDLLLYSNQSISDIAYQMGFGSTSNYIQHFHAATGCSPGSFRKLRCKEERGTSRQDTGALSKHFN